MTRLRLRIARWLVGPFVNIPDRDGVWVVTRMDGGRNSMTVEADKFRLKTGITPRRDLSKTFYNDTASAERFGLLTRWGRFVGTVKYR